MNRNFIYAYIEFFLAIAAGLVSVLSGVGYSTGPYAGFGESCLYSFGIPLLFALLLHSAPRNRMQAIKDSVDELPKLNRALAILTVPFCLIACIIAVNAGLYIDSKFMLGLGMTAVIIISAHLAFRVAKYSANHYEEMASERWLYANYVFSLPTQAKWYAVDRFCAVFVMLSGTFAALFGFMTLAFELHALPEDFAEMWKSTL